MRVFGTVEASHYVHDDGLRRVEDNVMEAHGAAGEDASRITAAGA
jgi:hypothetical protein